MSLIYTVILRGNKTVLCEYTEHSGNFQQISLNLLKTSKNVSPLTLPYEK